jgi:hypothetical protein
MKPKKIMLKRVTVSNLNSKDLEKVRAGDGRTIDSCGITNDCFTEFTCTVMPQCECSYMCTLTCPTIP